jgi:hypothetical protein
MTVPAAGFKRLIDLLTQLNIAYFVSGLLASSVHGLPRATMHIDLVADFRTEHIERLVAALSADFYAEAVAIGNLRISGPQRQLSDVRNVVGTRWSQLDGEYLDNWAKHLNVEDLLKRVFPS